MGHLNFVYLILNPLTWNHAVIRLPTAWEENAEIETGNVYNYLENVRIASMPWDSFSHSSYLKIVSYPTAKLEMVVIFITTCANKTSCLSSWSLCCTKWIITFSTSRREYLSKFRWLLGKDWTTRMSQKRSSHLFLDHFYNNTQVSLLWIDFNMLLSIL